jgi:lipopolysaccharide biosynthesis regulator YciM
MNTKKKIKIEHLQHTANLERGGRDGLQAKADLMVAYMFQYDNPWDKEVGKAQKELSSVESQKNRINFELISVRKKLAELDDLLLLTEAQRAEMYYQQLLVIKKATREKQEFKELAKKFREMEGYKDTKTLAVECERLYELKELEHRYDDLFRRMRKADSIDEFCELAKLFRALNYTDSNKVADECERQAQVLVKSTYDYAVKEFNELKDKNGNFS